jgi:hypothetical protein
MAGAQRGAGGAKAKVLYDVLVMRIRGRRKPDVFVL